MADPSIERFRRVVASAYAHLEARRQEVNDLNVFPVADGDTGDNMAMTMRAVMEELDRLDDSQSVDDIGRTQLVSAVAKAALMGARGNSGVILSQIVRGAAEELASRPGELVDPVLVASAFANAADAAYASVQEPAEGTMLTVFREMAHSISRQLAHIEPERQRLGPEASAEEQDALLAEVLEKAIEDGEAAVRRTPEQLDILADSGVVDAGGYGLVLILAGVLAALRGEDAELPEVAHQAAGRPVHTRSDSSRFRYCTNFIVSGSGLAARDHIPALEEIGDSVLVVGDPTTLKVHVHTDEPDRAIAVFDAAGEISDLDVADMRQQVADRAARLEGQRKTAVLAVASGEGITRLFTESGAEVVPGGETMNPSTSEILSAIEASRAGSVIVLPNSSNVIMAAERACSLAEREAVVVPTTTQQAGLLALFGFDPSDDLDAARESIEAELGRVRTGGVAPAARDDRQGRFRLGDAVGFIDDEIVAWGGAGSALASTIEQLCAKDAELVTVIAGEDAPVPLEGIQGYAPEGVDLELHEGGQPSWWWLLASQ